MHRLKGFASRAIKEGPLGLEIGLERSYMVALWQTTLFMLFMCGRGAEVGLPWIKESIESQNGDIVSLKY